MTSVTFDGTQIVNSTYIPQFTKHESVAGRDLNAVELALQDGSILVSTRYGSKNVALRGILNASSLANLDAAIDTFTELFSRKEKNLDIAWNGGTRRYVATCTSLEFDRDFFNTVHVPWTAEFVVSNGYGMDTSTTNALTQQSLTTTTPSTSSFVMLGSKAAMPDIKLEGGNFSSTTKGIMFENLDTLEKMIITKNDSWSGPGDYVKIYCGLKSVVSRINTILPESPINFYGSFPHFQIGTNNFRITAGSIMNQGYDDSASNFGTGFLLSNTNSMDAQSFMVPRTDTTFSGYEIFVGKTGAPGNITLRLETDSGNKPSGVAVTNSTVTAAHATVSTTPGYVRFSTSSSVTLQANTRYWLRISGAATLDGSNLYTIYHQNAKYALGNRSSSTDGGSTWTDDPATDIGFKILFGGVAGASTTKVTVTYTKNYL